MNNFLPYVYENNFIPETQPYKKSKGCETKLIGLLKYIATAFNDKYVIFIDIIFLYFSNAFNCVPHNALFKKLSKVNCSNFPLI
jgi:hypothetical protein